MQALLADHPELDIVEREPQFYQDLQMQYFTFSLHHNRYAFWIITSVSEAIEEAQIDSWQKLIRILIHEISNSVAPVHSLADTLADLCQQQSQKQAHQDEEFYTDVRDGLRVISQRSEGLLGFVEEYRKLVHIPNVNTDVVSLKKVFDAMKTLFEQEFNEANIKLETQLSSADLVIKADEKLFEQVLINLLINAKHAIERAGHQQGEITLSASINRYSKTQIKVTDNGTGIAKSALEKIFVPFFTTKSDGSGIGLSLCKQIIHKHKGALQVSSVEGEGSEFRIIL